MKGILLAVFVWLSAATCRGTNDEVPTVAPVGSPQTPEELELVCSDGDVLTEGEYRVENNAWGKGSLTGWSQCVGLGRGPDGSVAARFTWDWPDVGTNVKAYPELIFGYKPGSSATTSYLPMQVSAVEECTVRYDLSITHSGVGNIAFDIWLTDTDRPASFSVPPITHEVMIWLQSYGEMKPGGTLRERTMMSGTAYDVFVGEQFGSGWRYIAFNRVDTPRSIDTLAILPFLEYVQQEGLISGAEYLSSIEFGNEIVAGAGDTRIRSYEVSVR